MKHGVLLFPTDYTMDPATMAQEVEDRGFDSLWFPEHSHVPAPLGTEQDHGGRPRAYSHLHDPFIALTVAARATTRLLLGTAVCLVAQRDPITTAKEVASLDHLSGGRFLFGIGAGSDRAESADHGVDPTTRVRRMAENVEAMKALWTQELAEFHGVFVDFGPALAYPKPARTPHPPIYVGGMSRGVESRVLDHGDGWLPQGVGLRDLDEFGVRLKGLRHSAAARGRERIPVTIVGAESTAEAQDGYRRVDVDRVVYVVTHADRDATLAELDTLAGRLGS